MGLGLDWGLDVLNVVLEVRHRVWLKVRHRVWLRGKGLDYGGSN